MISIRRAAERLSRGRSLWRRLPRNFGRAPLLISPDAALQLMKLGDAAFDPMLLRLCREYVARGSVAWDVGANVGIFSLGAAALGAEVLAIEPDPFLGGLLRRTAAHSDNRALVLDVIGAAVASEPGTARLAIAERGRASNFLEEFAGRSMAGGTRSSCLVPVLTLDLLLRDRRPPDLVKIDVEGAEVAVLDGARQLLETVRPTILIEVNGETGREVLARFRALGGYRVFDFETGVECVDGNPLGMNLMACPIGAGEPQP
ncbi:FkbM family methyltransferase [Amorphus suaedae]